MKNLLTKLLLSTLAGLIILFSFAPYFSPAKAQTWYNQSFQEWYGKVYDPTNPSEIFGERYTAAQVQWIVYGMWSFLINTVTGPQNAGLMQCFISNTASIDVCMTQLKDLVAVKVVNNVQNPTIAGTKTQPEQNIWSLVFASDRSISGISYFKERVQKLNPVPNAYAQTPGIGFSVLQPVQQMWRAFRNFSFGLFIIVAIIFAFMIMFRVKLSPQTVVSVQSALPKIIVSLILVTFSYAIAGFLIDLMYIVIGIVSVIGSQLIMVGTPNIQVGLNSTAWFNFLTLGQPLGFNMQVGALGILSIYLITFFVCLVILSMINVGIIGTALAGGAFVALIASPVGPFLGLIVIIIAVIAFVVAVWMMIKVMWGLLKAFVNILLLTIIAPIQLLLGTFVPSLSFGSWVKNYISNLAIFVITGALILFSFVFLAQGVQIGLSGYFSGSIGNILAKALIGSVSGVSQIAAGNVTAWPPLLGGGGEAGVGLLFVLASFVIFTMIPKANELIQSLLSGKPMSYGTSINELTGPAGSAYAAYGANQIANGGLPAPFGRIPGATTWMRGQNDTQRKQWAETLQNLFRPRR